MRQRLHPSQREPAVTSTAADLTLTLFAGPPNLGMDDMHSRVETVGLVVLFILQLYAKRVRLFGYRTIKFTDAVMP